jgi:hypothetical protein
VNGNVQPGQNGLTLKERKNSSSVRINKLTKMAIEALRQHQGRQAIERETMRTHWHELDLVFPTTVGRLERSQNFVYGRRHRCGYGFGYCPQKALKLGVDAQA